MEYDSRRIKMDGVGVGNIVEACNAMAVDGWRLVSTIVDRTLGEGPGVWLLFERPTSTAHAK